MALDVDDVQMILDEVGRFASERILPQSARYEHPMDASTVHRLLGELGDIGVLPAASDNESPGLWTDVEDARSIQLSLGLLRHLGQRSAAIAFAAHRQSLSRWLLSQVKGLTELDELSDVALVMFGHHGLARGSLGRWLSDEMPITTDDKALLEDWLDFKNNQAAVWSTPHWQHLIMPTWIGGQVQWACYQHHQLALTPHVAPHGLEELEISSARSLGQQPASVSQLPANDSRRVYASLLKMEYLGLMAIGLGVLSRGRCLARDFAAIRRQGGALINQHAAVQIMLSDITSTEQLLENLMSGFGRALSSIRLEEVASARYSTSELLVKASHQVIQVHGGIGYMRDAGPEKFVRDQNMLRLTAGGAWALPLLISGLKEGQAI